MSLSAADTFRPTTWDDLTLSLSDQQIDDLRYLPYGKQTISLLFWGDFGLGKTEASRFLTRCVICRNSTAPLGDPCRSCGACTHDWTSRHYVDNSVLEIDCPRDAPRDILERIDAARRYRPCFPLDEYSGTVVILDEVHRNDRLLSERLLKILEEPSQDLFILATARPELLDEALVQRCIDFELTTPDVHRCESWLSRHLSRSGIKAPASTISELVEDGERIPRRIRNLVRRRLRPAADGTLELR